MSARHSMADVVKFGKLACLGEFFPCGSRITCDPPPVGTDEDWLVYTRYMWRFREEAFEAGFNLAGSQILDAVTPLDETNRFSSYLRGEENLIVTQDRNFFNRFVAATSVAKRLNLLDKEDRIALFQAVLYGNPCEERAS